VTASNNQRRVNHLAGNEHADYQKQQQVDHAHAR
jgi:hypothetical protein